MKTDIIQLVKDCEKLVSNIYVFGSDAEYKITVMENDSYISRYDFMAIEGLTVKKWYFTDYGLIIIVNEKLSF